MRRSTLRGMGPGRNQGKDGDGIPEKPAAMKQSSGHLIAVAGGIRIPTPIVVPVDERVQARTSPARQSSTHLVAVADVMSRPAPAIQPAAPSAKRAGGHAQLWKGAAVAAFFVGIALWMLPGTPNAIAGFSLREIGTIATIVFLSGVVSGLSGFGFSAVGAVSLLFLAPVAQVPLFQALSTGNQLVSMGQLRKDMPKTRKEFWAGPGPFVVGGAFGVPIGIWLLANLPASLLMAVFGTLLTLYAAYSVWKPASLVIRGGDKPMYGVGVGFLGGMIGGFTAFPGAAVVVWSGLRGLPKERHRAIVQPYIILSQIYSLGLLAWLHPDYLNARFWILLALALPAMVPGTLSGLFLYRRTSDVNFRRITYLLLGISGISLLAKVLGPTFGRLF